MQNTTRWRQDVIPNMQVSQCINYSRQWGDSWQTCMQSLLQAVGVGAKNSLPAAAGINWVLKDGLGRLGRLSVSTRFGTSFDSNLKASSAA